MPEGTLTVTVIDPSRARAAIVEEGLRASGVARVVVIAETGDLPECLARIDPDVIVIDLQSPSRDLLEQMFHVSRLAERPVAMFVDNTDGAMLEAAIDAGMSAYVVDGLKPERVKAIVDTAILRFNAFARLQRELAEARGELADRKVVEKAKGLIMKARGVGEAEAYALLRRTAMNEKRKLADIARHRDRGGPDRMRLSIGYVPLTDAAPLVAAAERGFAAEEGLELDVVREPSWAPLRDKLALGRLDGAHLLAPLGIACTLGLSGPKAALMTPFALNLNGNAVTVSLPLWTELADLGADDDVETVARAFGMAAREGLRRGGRLRLVTVFPISTHTYQLRILAERGGVALTEVAEVTTVPLPLMVEALRSGAIDGLCVGSPWNARSP